MGVSRHEYSIGLRKGGRKEGREEGREEGVQRAGVGFVLVSVSGMVW